MGLSLLEQFLTVAVWLLVVLVFLYYRHRAVAEQRKSDAERKRPAGLQFGRNPSRLSNSSDRKSRS